MTQAAKSIVTWGVSALLTGLALLIQPNMTLDFLGFEATFEHWILFVALLLMGFGSYYIVLGIAEVKLFFVTSIFARMLFFVLSTALIILGKAPVNMLVFSVFDFVTAIWTGLAMHSDKKTAQ